MIWFKIILAECSVRVAADIQKSETKFLAEKKNNSFFTKKLSDFSHLQVTTILSRCYLLGQ